MELQRRFGVIIVCGIPAIVGSGLLWALSEKWALVFAYLFLLVLSLLLFLVAPQRITSLIQLLNPVSDRIKGLGSKLRESFGTQSLKFTLLISDIIYFFLSYLFHLILRWNLFLAQLTALQSIPVGNLPVSLVDFSQSPSKDPTSLTYQVPSPNITVHLRRPRPPLPSAPQFYGCHFKVDYIGGPNGPWHGII